MLPAIIAAIGLAVQIGSSIYSNKKSATNPKEFEKILEKVPASSKLFFLQNSMKYIFNERGKEADGEDEQQKNGTKYDEMAEIASKALII
jgi:hypothetical protein